MTHKQRRWGQLTYNSGRCFVGYGQVIVAVCGSIHYTVSYMGQIRIPFSSSAIHWDCWPTCDTGCDDQPVVLLTVLWGEKNIDVWFRRTGWSRITTTVDVWQHVTRYWDLFVSEERNMLHKVKMHHGGVLMYIWHQSEAHIRFRLCSAQFWKVLLD